MPTVSKGLCFYDVDVCRLSHDSARFTVLAESEEDAKNKAIEKAGDYCFGSGNAEYEVTYVSKTTEKQDAKHTGA